MTNFPSPNAQWRVSAFPAANPERPVVVRGLCGRTLRAYCAAADAMLAAMFELHDTGLVFASVSVGADHRFVGIDPATLDVSEFQPFVDGLLDLSRPTPYDSQS